METDLDETFNGNEGTTGFTITRADEETDLSTLAGILFNTNLDGGRRPCR